MTETEAIDDYRVWPVIFWIVSTLSAMKRFSSSSAAGRNCSRGGDGRQLHGRGAQSPWRCPERSRSLCRS
jgi:hypothetical protein